MLAWYRTIGATPMPDHDPTSPSAQVRIPLADRDQCAELRRVIEFLVGGAEALATLEAKAPQHPAAVAIRALRSLERPGGPDYESLLATMRRFAGSVLDSETWFSSVAVGSSTIPEEAWRVLRSRLRDQNQFADVMAELHVWGDLARYRPTRFITDESRPDLEVRAHGLHVGVEVKRIHRETKPARIRKVLLKANKQLRQFDANVSGIVFVLLERDPDRASLDDDPPGDVKAYVEAVRAELREGFLRSISRVLVAWDELQIVGSAFDRVGAFTFIRKSVCVEHPAPWSSPDLGEPSVELGSVVTREVVYSDMAQVTLPPLHLGGHAFSEPFRNYDEKVFGVRAEHALEAIASPTARVDLRQGDGHTMSLITRTSTLAPYPHTLLIVVFSGADSAGIPLVQHAWRLWPRTGRPEASDPMANFLWFLDEFGSDVVVGSIRGRFVYRAVVTPDKDGNRELVTPLWPADVEAHEEAVVVAYADVLEKPSPHAIVTFVFNVLYKRYRRELLRVTRKGRRSGDPRKRAAALPRPFRGK